MTSQPGGTQSSFFLITQWVALAVVMVALIVFIYQQSRIWKAVDKLNSELTVVQKDVRAVKKNRPGAGRSVAGKRGAEQAKTSNAASAGSSVDGNAAAPDETVDADGSEETVVHMDVPKPALKHAKHGTKRHHAVTRASKRLEASAHRKHFEGKTGGGGARTHHLYVPVRHFADPAAAKHERDRLLRLGLPATLRHDRGATSVLLGPFSSKRQADTYKQYAQRAMD
jgi:hypothetical protein